MTVRIKLNRQGIREILRSDGVKADLSKRAQRVRNAAGPGHAVDVTTGRNRVRASVRTDTIDAMLAQAETKNLTRAMQAARG